MSDDDYTVSDEDQEFYSAMLAAGHTEHCACRLAFGDGECECDRAHLVRGVL